MEFLLIILLTLAFGEGSILNNRRGKAQDDTWLLKEKDLDGGSSQLRSLEENNPSDEETNLELEDKGWGWGLSPQLALVGISQPVFGMESGSLGWTPIGWIQVKPSSCGWPGSTVTQTVIQSSWGPPAVTTSTVTATSTGWISSTSTIYQTWISTQTSTVGGWGWKPCSGGSSTTISATIDTIPTYIPSYTTLTETTTVEGPTPTVILTGGTTTITTSYSTITPTTVTLPYPSPSTTSTTYTTTSSTIYTDTSLDYSIIGPSTTTTTVYLSTVTVPGWEADLVECTDARTHISCFTPLSTFTITLTATSIYVQSPITATYTGISSSTLFTNVQPSIITDTLTVSSPATDTPTTSLTQTLTTTADVNVITTSQTTTLSPAGSSITLSSSISACPFTKYATSTITVTSTPCPVTYTTTFTNNVNAILTASDTIFSGKSDLAIETSTVTTTFLQVSTILISYYFGLTMITTTIPTYTFYDLAETTTTLSTTTVFSETTITKTSTPIQTTSQIIEAIAYSPGAETTSIFTSIVTQYTTATVTGTTLTTVTPSPVTVTATRVVVSLPCSVTSGGGIGSGWNAGWNVLREEEEGHSREIHLATTPLPGVFQ